MSDIQIKGQMLRQYLDVIGDLYGREAKADVFRRLDDPAFREAAQEGRLLASGWYPVAWANQMLRAATEALPQHQDLPEKVSRAAMERDMKGIYGFLTRFLSPEFCAKQAPRILGTFNRGMNVEATVTGKGVVELRFTSSRGIIKEVWRAMFVGTLAIFEKAGATGVRSELVRGGHELSEETLVRLYWSA